jgi:hypothetical protein
MRVRERRVSFDSKVPILVKNKELTLKSWRHANVEHVSAVVTLYESAFSIARWETRHDAVFHVVNGLP